jgi:carotenoid cleavage dioxygenase
MNPNDRGVPQFSGITKYDLQLAGAGGGGARSAVAGQVLHGGSRLGGEAVFVPKPKPGSSGSNDKEASQAGQGQLEEDAGYLMTFVTDEASLQSELVIYDAASMASAPVARLRLPQRVPHGFHGAWVSAGHLAAQAARQREEGAAALA